MNTRLQRPLRLLSWNIRHGGGKRIDAIFRQLKRWRADIIGLCEFRGTEASQTLASWLADRGYVHQVSTIDTARATKNALLLASKLPFRNHSLAVMPALPQRWLLVEVETRPMIKIGLMHVPNYTAPELKYPYLEAIHRMIDETGLRSAILLGDTNCGKRGIDEQKYSSVLFRREHDWIEGLEARQWLDVFRHLHGERRVYSWYSHRNNGFRLDQAYCSPDLGHRVVAAGYKWGRDRQLPKRRDALSDHAALVVDLDLASSAPGPQE